MPTDKQTAIGGAPNDAMDPAKNMGTTLVHNIRDKELDNRKFNIKHVTNSTDRHLKPSKAGTLLPRLILRRAKTTVISCFLSYI